MKIKLDLFVCLFFFRFEYSFVLLPCLNLCCVNLVVRHKKVLSIRMASPTEDSPPPPASSITTPQNYYDLLGITPEATDEEIKRAYRKLALRLR